MEIRRTTIWRSFPRIFCRFLGKLFEYTSNARQKLQFFSVISIEMTAKIANGRKNDHKSDVPCLIVFFEINFIFNFNLKYSQWRI